MAETIRELVSEKAVDERIDRTWKNRLVKIMKESRYI